MVNGDIYIVNQEDEDIDSSINGRKVLGKIGRWVEMGKMS